MKRNMGTADRVIRFVIAVAIGLLYYNNYLTGALGIVLLAVAAIILVTSIAGFCPLYALFHISTCVPAKTKTDGGS